jgi:chaperonin GroES
MILPLGNRVVIKRSAAPEKKGTILLVDNGQEKQRGGVIMTIGATVTEVKVGDHVLFGKYAGMPIGEEVDELLLVDVKEILGIFS